MKKRRSFNSQFEVNLSVFSFNLTLALSGIWKEILAVLKASDFSHNLGLFRRKMELVNLNVNALVKPRMPP